jgi:UDP-N-acetylglucosamine 1-carboxyvinyltransferase
MEKFEINGGKKLFGEVEISGSKNAVLPIMAASILAEGKSIIHNVPRLEDVFTMIKILTYLGANVKFDNQTLEIDSSGINKFDAPYEFVKTMRASISFLGPLIAKFKKAEFSLPGGCVIGSRPIDLHIKGLQELGADIKISDGYIVADAENGLKGRYIFLGGNFGSSVLATCNLMCAAVFAQGETIIEFAACEPEVIDLALYLSEMGAKISGIGSPYLKIEGVKTLKSVEWTVIPDRIETGTFILAGAITSGKIKVKKCQPCHLGAFLEKITACGITCEKGKDYIEVSGKSFWQATDIVTLPYPGFPTDLQAQMMAFLCLADGVSVVTEKIFPERFIHVSELNRLGANIILNGATAIIRGVKKFYGAKVMASDLRASAALVLAGLMAEGKTEVSRIYHLRRGYENFEKKLQNLGAEIITGKE